MRKEHRPAALRRAHSALERRFARHFVEPHFDAVGRGCQFDNPWSIRVFGPCIELGERVHIRAAAGRPVSLGFWAQAGRGGRLRIGDYAMLNPGVRIAGTHDIRIGRNALFASGVYVTDCDWHGLYDRVQSGDSAPVTLHDNVWLGEQSIVCKGVTIGENSVVGAGAVVVKDIPANSVAVGNPARVVSELDPTRAFVSREDVFRADSRYLQQLQALDRQLTQHNGVASYLRYLLWPRRGD